MKPCRRQPRTSLPRVHILPPFTMVPIFAKNIASLWNHWAKCAHSRVRLSTATGDDEHAFGGHRNQGSAAFTKTYTLQQSERGILLNQRREEEKEIPRPSRGKSTRGQHPPANFRSHRAGIDSDRGANPPRAFALCFPNRAFGTGNR